MGESDARAFLSEGANVVIADVLEKEGQALAHEFGERALFVRLDISSEADWAAAVAAAESSFGQVTVLVNNAAIVRVQPLVEIDPVDWRRVIDINLTGPYLGIRAVV